MLVWFLSVFSFFVSSFPAFDKQQASADMFHDAFDYPGMKLLL
jgi:hypothetical protein